MNNSTKKINFNNNLLALIGIIFIFSLILPSSVCADDSSTPITFTPHNFYTIFFNNPIINVYATRTDMFVEKYTVNLNSNSISEGLSSNPGAKIYINESILKSVLKSRNISNSFYENIISEKISYFFNNNSRFESIIDYIQSIFIDNFDEVIICEENWTCSEWSSCDNGVPTQNRTCIDINECESTDDKPDLSESCFINEECDYDDWDPSCGLDDVTYRSPCYALKQSGGMAYNSPCVESCTEKPCLTVTLNDHHCVYTNLPDETQCGNSGQCGNGNCYEGDEYLGYLNCNDEDLCTKDHYSEDTETCSYTDKEMGSYCYLGLGIDHGGECVRGYCVDPALKTSSCDDLDPCTTDQDMGSGVCSYEIAARGTLCDNGVCLNGKCSPARFYTPPLSCDDGNVCTYNFGTEGDCHTMNYSNDVSCGNLEFCNEGQCLSFEEIDWNCDSNDWDPSCGLDDVTYSSPCTAQSHSGGMSYNSPCVQTCTEKPCLTVTLNDHRCLYRNLPDETQCGNSGQCANGYCYEGDTYLGYLNCDDSNMCTTDHYSEGTETCSYTDKETGSYCYLGPGSDHGGDCFEGVCTDPEQ